MHSQDTTVNKKLSAKVVAEGFSILADAPSAIADVVFIHGLGGHPRATWQFGSEASEKPNHLSRIARLFRYHPYGNRNDGGKTKESCFWPEELLAKDFPECRIATYGYDSRVSNFFDGAANQMHISAHGKNLLSDLIDHRHEAPHRRMIFIVHSLGGIILKEALRQAWHERLRIADAGTDGHRQDSADVYEATKLIIFMGTPHRGSGYANWGLSLRKMAVAVGIDASDKILQNLKDDSEILENLRRDFAKMLRDAKFEVWTFMEQQGMNIPGLHERIVKDASSCLDDAKEKVYRINANHMNMCRFRDATDQGYKKVKSVLSKHLDRAVSTEDSVPPLAAMEMRELQEMGESLYDPATSLRMAQVDIACSETFEWLFDEELGFKEWLKQGDGLYWIKGKPASGKSTMMLFAYEHRTTHGCLEGAARLAFFFHDRGSHIQKSFEGLLKSLLDQLFTNFRGLKQAILPLYRKIKYHQKRDLPWTVDILHSAFDLLLEQNLEDANACIFLDALDEYSGPPDDIVRFLQKIVRIRPHSRTQLKVCFSSRPLQKFLDHFSNIPGFFLQDYTAGDITTSIQSKMRYNPRMLVYMNSALSSQREMAANFARTVASRAEGVFLWVRLVLDELLEDFTAGDNIDDLHERLSAIPADLEDYYQLIYDRISSKYKDDARVMFEILLRTERPLSALSLFKAYKIARISDLSKCSLRLKDDNITFDEVERTIRSRCGFLVEVKQGLVRSDSPVHSETPDRDTSLFYWVKNEHMHAQVQFIHRTAKSFFQQTLAVSVTPNSLVYDNGYVFLMKFLLSYPIQIHGFDHRFGEARGGIISKDLLVYAKLAEVTTQQPQTHILRQVHDDQISDLYGLSVNLEISVIFDDIGKRETDLFFPIESIWAFAALANLALFIQEEKVSTNQVWNRTGMALSIALFMSLDETNENDRLVSHESRHYGSHNRIPTLSSLMLKGAYLYKGYGRRTAMELLCEWGIEHYAHPGKHHAAIMRILLERRQSPNVTIRYNRSEEGLELRLNEEIKEIDLEEEDKEADLDKQDEETDRDKEEKEVDSNKRDEKTDSHDECQGWSYEKTDLYNHWRSWFNHRSCSPLHLAAAWKSTDHISLLLQYGAAVNHRCERGRTPLDYAVVRFGDRVRCALQFHYQRTDGPWQNRSVNKTSEKEPHAEFEKVEERSIVLDGKYDKAQGELELAKLRKKRAKQKKSAAQTRKAAVIEESATPDITERILQAEAAIAEAEAAISEQAVAIRKLRRMIAQAKKEKEYAERDYRAWLQTEDAYHHLQNQILCIHLLLNHDGRCAHTAPAEARALRYYFDTLRERDSTRNGKWWLGLVHFAVQLLETGKDPGFTPLNFDPKVLSGHSDENIHRELNALDCHDFQDSGKSRKRKRY